MHELLCFPLLLKLDLIESPIMDWLSGWGIFSPHHNSLPQFWRSFRHGPQWPDGQFRMPEMTSPLRELEFFPKILLIMRREFSRMVFPLRGTLRIVRSRLKLLGKFAIISLPYALIASFSVKDGKYVLGSVIFYKIYYCLWRKPKRPTIKGYFVLSLLICFYP